MSASIAALLGGFIGGLIGGIWQGWRYSRVVAAAEAVLAEYDLQDETMIELADAVKASRGQAA